MLRIALYQPDIPQNTGTILRMAACLDLAVDIIEPAGFQLGDARFRRALMDYGQTLDMTRHTSWPAYLETVGSRRLVLLTTSASTSLYRTNFLADDILLLGRESAGVPPDLHQRADLRVMVPMAPGTRSLNVAVAAAMAAGEALRQTRFTGEMPSLHETE
jgi:tRNA (cytidine/uridine-2'-O-)-methyltransferase